MEHRLHQQQSAVQLWCHKMVDLSKAHIVDKDGCIHQILDENGELDHEKMQEHMSRVYAQYIEPPKKWYQKLNIFKKVV